MIDSFKGQLCKNVEIIIQIYGLSCSVNNTLIDKELVTLVLAVYFYIDQKKTKNVIQNIISLSALIVLCE